MDYSFVPNVDDVQVTGRDFEQFGLNQGAMVTRFEVCPNGEGTLSPGVRVCVKVSDSKFDQNGYVFFESKFADTQDKKEGQHREVMATLSHIANALGVSNDNITSALQQRKPQSILQYAQVICGLCATRVNQVPVDVFMQYQKKLGNDGKVHVDLPNSVRQGAFMAPATQGAWKKVEDASGLRYHRPGNPQELHPFQRSAYFMGTVQGKGPQPQADDMFEQPQAVSAPQPEQPFTFDDNQSQDLPF